VPFLALSEPGDKKKDVLNPANKNASAFSFVKFFLRPRFPGGRQPIAEDNQLFIALPPELRGGTLAHRQSFRSLTA
jgi:hypothetical protein